MKEHFKDWNPQAKTLALVETAGNIIDEYRAAGYILTLRQLYYQFVARDIIENSERSYKNLGASITNARMAGLIDWTAIEDRNRGHHSYWTDENIMNPINNLSAYIRFDQWARQDVYIEVWVEKEALGNVISGACRPWLVPYLSCKGYLSASEMWRAAKRFEQKEEEGKHCVVIHLGDHDPSGMDMTRDNDDRLELLSNHCEIDVRRIALNKDQIDHYSPPPNPAKLSDSRAKEYIKRYGRTSWELDALEPKVITNLINSEIMHYLDKDKWDDVRYLEHIEKNKLDLIGENWIQIEQFLREEGHNI